MQQYVRGTVGSELTWLLRPSENELQEKKEKNKQCYLRHIVIQLCISVALEIYSEAAKMFRNIFYVTTLYVKNTTQQGINKGIVVVMGLEHMVILPVTQSLNH